MPNGTEAGVLRSGTPLADPTLPLERGKYPFETTLTHTRPMRTKHVSDALKRQRQTFHLARHDPERWKQEKETTLLENLHDAQERAGVAERDAEVNKQLAEERQEQARIFIVYEYVTDSWDKKKVNRLKERLVTFENEHKGQRQTNAATSNKLESKNETPGRDCLRYQDRTSKLQREVRNLRKKVLRAPGQRSHAVEVAVTRTASELGGHSNVWKIKHPNGRIKNWIRDLTCRLITVHHIPATQAPGVVSEVIRALRANTGDDCNLDADEEETFSDRSARRFPLEGCIMGEMMVAEELKTAPG